MCANFSSDGSRVTIEVYDYMCEIGNHYVMKAYGPFHCAVCGKVSCLQHIPHFNCCETCWAKLSDAEKEEKKKSFRQRRKISIGYFIYSFSVLFLIPLVVWLISGNNFAIIGGVIVGIVLWLIPSLNMIKERIKFEDKDGKKLREMQDWVNTHQDVIHAPDTFTFHGQNIVIQKNGRLTLVNQGIKSIKEIGGLEKTNFLAAIDLSGNQITKIEGFQGCASLQSLTLANNQISKIEGLEGTTMVSLLDLSNNKITKIEGLADHWNLKYLYLQGNPIEWPTELNGRTDTQAIVEYCKWLKTNKPSASTVKPEKKKFESNQNTQTFVATPAPTTFIPPTSQITPPLPKPKNDFGYLWVGSEMIQVYSDESISIPKKNIKRITEIRGLDRFPHLQKLDLSSNLITKIEGLDKFPDLLELDLGHNPITKIEGLDKLVKLTLIRLRSNQLTKIEGLDSLSQLQLLDLGNNQITKIEGLDKLVNLKKLYLYSNQITKLEGLESLTNAETIDLKDNPIAPQVVGKKAQDLVAQCRGQK